MVDVNTTADEKRFLVVIINKLSNCLITISLTQFSFCFKVVETASDDSLSEDESPKKRRDLLTRRPSYRKILNDLGGGEIAGMLFNCMFWALDVFREFFNTFFSSVHSQKLFII